MSKKTEIIEAELVEESEGAVQLTDKESVLVEQAVTDIQNIYIGHALQVYIDVGKYLLATFYDDDLERFKEKKPVEASSFNELCKRFSEMNNAPKKSWLYNAMNLYYENHYEIGLFHAHGKDIVATNQLALLTVEDEKIQEELIVEVAENKISTRVLKERIKSFSEGSLTNTKKYRKSLKSIKTMLRNKKTHLEGTAKQVQTLKSKLSAWEKEIEGLLEESK